MALTDAQRRANNKYIAKAYEEIRFKTRKEYRLNDLINFASEQKNVSKADYIQSAIRAKLDADGITIDMLPDVSEGSEQE